MLRSTEGRRSPMVSFPIDACLDDFSHPLRVHGLFNRPTLNHVPSESPIDTDSKTRDAALSDQLVKRGWVNLQWFANFFHRRHFIGCHMGYEALLLFELGSRWRMRIGD